MTELAAAVTGRYDAFARYPLAAHVAGCTHCVSDADHARLHEAPLRALTADALSRYAHKAMTTWGTVDDFKHFLPRLFELLPEHAVGLGADLVIGKLDDAWWRTWPAAEIAAVERYLAALWPLALRDGVRRVRAHELLRAGALIGIDLAPWLAAWAAERAPSAARQLAELVDEIGGRRLPPAVAAWLREPARIAQLEAAFFRGDEDAARLGHAVDVLTVIAGS